MEEKQDFIIYKPRGGHSILLPFEPRNLRMSAPESRQGTNRVCRIFYQHNGEDIPFRVQFPRMSSPFPLSKPTFQGITKNFFQFSVSFYGEQSRPELVEFRDFLNEAEGAMIDLLHLNSAEWFKSADPRAPKRQQSYELIRDKFSSVLKSGYSQKKNKHYDDNIALKCPVRNDVLQTVFFNDDNPPQSIVDLEKIETQQTHVTIIAEIRELWIVQRYHPKFEAVQVQIFQSYRRDDAFGFVATTSPTDDPTRNSAAAEITEE